MAVDKCSILWYAHRAHAPGQLLAAAQPAQVTGNRAALWIRLSGNRATLSSRMSVHTNPGLMCLSGVCTDKNTCSSAAVLKLHGSHGTSAPALCATLTFLPRGLVPTGPVPASFPHSAGNCPLTHHIVLPRSQC